MQWLIALAVAVGGFIIGGAVSAFVRRNLEKPTRDERLKNLAGPISTLIFGLIVSLGLVVALGIGDPDSLKPLPHSLIAFVPRLIMAALFAIGGTAISSLAANAVAMSVMKATGKPQPQIGRAVRIVVVAIFSILAVSQLGINTKVVDLLVTGVIGSLALSFALITGVGSRHVAADVAAGRYLRRVLQTGDLVQASLPDEQSPVTGKVVSVHGATVEMGSTADGKTVILHVPNSMLLRSVLRIERDAPTGPGGAVPSGPGPAATSGQ
jgi:hypothetical protein